MEHLSTFGLRRDPFANEPRHSPWFASPGQVEAERRLVRGIRQARGLCVLCGAGGAGKTMLVRHLLESLEEEVFEACMLVPVPGVSDGRWVLDRFARQLGVEEPAADGAKLLGQVYEQLAIVREDGRHTVLLIDEAQVLADHGVLAELRALLNLEYEDRRLLTLVLVGLPGLDASLAGDPALADRVEVRVVLPSFEPMTAAGYLVHRLEAAGGSAAAFDSSAVDALVKASGGNPRRLNVLGDNALFEAHLAGRDRVNARDVEKAAAELGLEPAVPSAPAAGEPARGIEVPVGGPVAVPVGGPGQAPAGVDAVEPHPAPAVESAAASGPEPDPAPAAAPGLAPDGAEASDALAGPEDEALDDLFEDGEPHRAAPDAGPMTAPEGAPMTAPEGVPMTAPDFEPGGPDLELETDDGPELLMEDVIAADTNPPWATGDGAGDRDAAGAPGAWPPSGGAPEPSPRQASEGAGSADDAGAPASEPSASPDPAPRARERIASAATDEGGDQDGEIEALFADLVDD